MLLVLIAGKIINGEQSLISIQYKFDFLQIDFHQIVINMNRYLHHLLSLLRLISVILIR